MNSTNCAYNPDVLMSNIDVLRRENKRLEDKLKKLEKEANWLAQVLADKCGKIGNCPADGNPIECGWMEARHWRNKARIETE